MVGIMYVIWGIIFISELAFPLSIYLNMFTCLLNVFPQNSICTVGQ